MSGDRRVDHDSQVDGKQIVVSMQRPHGRAVCLKVPLARTPVWAVRTPVYRYAHKAVGARPAIFEYIGTLPGNSQAQSSTLATIAVPCLEGATSRR